MLKSIILNLIFISLISLSLLFFIDGNHKFKYNLIHSSLKVFQNKYEKSAYYQFEVPNDWILINRGKEDLTFLAPTEDNNIMITVQVLTNFDKVASYVQYFDPNYCQNIDENKNILNDVLVENSEESKNIQLPAKIIYCNSSESHKSFVAYMNESTITNILITPYESKYKHQYTNILKEMKFIIKEEMIPDWISK